MAVFDLGSGHTAELQGCNYHTACGVLWRHPRAWGGGQCMVVLQMDLPEHHTEWNITTYYIYDPNTASISNPITCPGCHTKGNITNGKWVQL